MTILTPWIRSRSFNNWILGENEWKGGFNKSDIVHIKIQMNKKISEGQGSQPFSHAFWSERTHPLLPTFDA